jgi:hypothetical protein
MKHIKLFEDFLNKNTKAHNDVLNILKNLHGFSNKIKFSVEDVNRRYNIVYDDPNKITQDYLKQFQDRKFWNTGFAPTIGKFANGRVNINFEIEAQDLLNIKDFDKKDWKA